VARAVRCNETAMTTPLHKGRRHLLTALGLVVVATCVTGCEPGHDFWITNATGETLTVQSRTQVPGEQVDPISPADQRYTLQSGQKIGLVLGLQRGNCKYYTFLSYDASGRLVDQDPTPICEDTHGHGNTWAIVAK
jgi:hypothetical protein